MIGDGPVTLMGCVNLSRDSTYRESVATGPDDAVRMGRIQAAQGAAIIDLGAESSNAGAARVSPADQVKTLVPVVERLAAEAVVSVETYEPGVVAACLDAGARILNMTGREHEDEMLTLAAQYDAAVVMCFGETANVREASDVPPDADPMPVLLDHFGPRIERARALGADKVVVDPGMGFHYGNLVDPLTRVAAPDAGAVPDLPAAAAGRAGVQRAAAHLRHLRRRVPQGGGLLRRLRRARRRPPAARARGAPPARGARRAAGPRGRLTEPDVLN